MKIKTGDAFIMWRIRQLINSGKIGTMGEVTRNWKDLDLKLGANEPVTAANA